MSIATDTLAKYRAAEVAVLSGQSYSFGDRTFTNANLAEICRRRQEWEQRVAAENARAAKAPTIGGLSYSLARLD